MFQVSGIWFIWIGNLRFQITSNICKIGTKAFPNIFWVVTFVLLTLKQSDTRDLSLIFPIPDFNTRHVFYTSPLNLYNKPP